MSLHFICGKIGGGKTLYAVKLLEDELRLTERKVVTNVSIKIVDLVGYLHQKYGRDFNAVDRIFSLDDETAKRFYLNRGGRTIECDITKGFQGDLGGGVLYIIDEVHIFFGSREWKETGREVIYYLSQHRKAGDDVICITQVIGNVDKQFRGLAQDFTTVRNLGKEGMCGFRLPSVFMRRTYLDPPPGGLNNECVGTAQFKLDARGLASCYETRKGVGILGRAGEVDKRKGFHWAWFIVMCVIGIALLIQIPRLIGWGAAKVFIEPIGNKIKSMQQGSGSNVVSGPPRQVEQLPVPSGTVPVATGLASGPSSLPPVPPGLIGGGVPLDSDKMPIEISGVTRFGPVVSLYLSDGRVISGSGQWTSDDTGITISGVKYFYASRKPQRISAEVASGASVALGGHSGRGGIEGLPGKSPVF